MYVCLIYKLETTHIVTLCNYCYYMYYTIIILKTEEVQKQKRHDVGGVSLNYDQCILTLISQTIFLPVLCSAASYFSCCF